MVIREERERLDHREHHKRIHGEHSIGVRKSPMAEFMCEHRQDFAFGKLRQQRIGDQNAVHAEKSVSGRIAVSRAPTAVDELHAIYAESDACSEVLNLLRERGRRKRREAVEKREEEARIEEIQSDGKEDQNRPEDEERAMCDMLVKRRKGNLRGGGAGRSSK